MKIFQYRGEHPNFGDELNSWLWPQLLPNFFDNNEETVFIGIGSTIGDAPRQAKKKIVFGAGFVPHYHKQPDIHGEDWHIYFVRGPRTAQRLGIDAKLALSDSGILVRDLMADKPRNARHTAFIPHWESMGRGLWERACEKAGVTLIDPRWPVEQVLHALLDSRLVIAEAMHGAIIADALRVPWVPVIPINAVHRDKWYDWAESLGMALRPQRLLPSNLTELNADSFRAVSPTAPPVNAVLSPNSDTHPSAMSRVKKLVARSALAPWIDERISDMAARHLQQLARIEGMLSSQQALDTAISAMHEKMVQLTRDYGANAGRAA